MKIDFLNLQHSFLIQNNRFFIQNFYFFIHLRVLVKIIKKLYSVTQPSPAITFPYIIISAFQWLLILVYYVHAHICTTMYKHLYFPWFIYFYYLYLSILFAGTLSQITENNKKPLILLWLIIRMATFCTFFYKHTLLANWAYFAVCWCLTIYQLKLASANWFS